jgi:hypothetical protein
MNTQSPILRALINPINLAMLALAVAAGLCSAWWLAPVGILLWVLMVVIFLRDPDVRMMEQIEPREHLAQRFQTYYNRLESTQVRIYRALSKVGKTERKLLDPIWQSVDSLVDEAYSFCERMSVMENHRLVTQRGINLKDQLADLDFRIKHETNPAVRKEFEESREALNNRYAGLLSLSKQLDRAEASLTGTSSSLAQVLTEILRIQSYEPERMAAEVAQLLEKIEKARGKIRDFDRNE